MSIYHIKFGTVKGETSMIRTFETHKVRKQRELTNCIWEFEALGGEHAGQIYQVFTPCCWENHPDFMNYRGEGIYRTKFWAEGNIRLEFKGVSHTATVFLDGGVLACEGRSGSEEYIRTNTDSGCEFKNLWNDFI